MEPHGKHRRVHVFGYPVANSTSPALHGPVFHSLGLPWTVSTLQSRDLAALERAMASPDFAGAAVTLPHKNAVIPLLGRLTDDARALGAVNTIYCLSGGDDGRAAPVFVGANTDWSGMAAAISSVMDFPGSSQVTRAEADTPMAGVVIGSGVLAQTSAYALVAGLGLRTVFFVGGDPDDRAAVSKALSGLSPGPLDFDLVSLDTLEHARSLAVTPRVIINSIRDMQPGNERHKHAQLLARHLIKEENRPRHMPGSAPPLGNRVLLDLAYMLPVNTELVSCAKASGWEALSFVHFMAHQAVQQGKLWTGIDAERFPPVHDYITRLSDVLSRKQTR